MNMTTFEKTQKLLPTEDVETFNIIEREIADADKRLKKRLPIINCECGAEILVVPDLQAMNRAIKTHVAQHRKKKRNNVIAPRGISQLLNQLTLTKMSEKSDT